MIFKGIHPQTGETLWGCPKIIYRKWQIEWFASNNFGFCEGETDPTPDQLLWIIGFPLEVAEMQRKMLAWQETVDDIPF